MFSFRSSVTQHPLFTLVMGGTAVLLVLCIVSYPDQAFQASLQGLKVWWNIIFPALLPFLVLSEILIAYGFVHGLGVLLDPLMRVLFRLPGVGGWAWSVGWTAGYPAGAEAVIRLRKQQALTRREAERLLGLSHASSPIFMIAVVGVGFVQQAEVGLIIAIVHWASAILAMFILRSTDAFHPEPKSVSVSELRRSTRLPFYRRMLDAMELAHRQDGRPFGKLLGDAVTSAVQTLMMIGGYMMIFSVIIRVLRIAIPQELGSFMLNGLLEVNLGAYTFGSAAFQSTLFQTALLGAVIAWSGVSAHMQVHSLMKGSDLRYMRFLASRIVHAVAAYLLTYVLWWPLQALFHDSDSALSAFETLPDLSNAASSSSAVPASSLIHEKLTSLAAYTGWSQSLVLIPGLGLLLLCFIAVSRMLRWISNRR
ncbi:nucleoside recognition domain-containing protein [Paenibacillus sp. MER TA 81-3]|uniref:nucleoside recognition domain-containing protein n=1 Tax=Paenibacillus sp. MER TA 81-3 TaxID=2939573 RepID=UPI00203A85AA|nr:nucleoside recognition domain-containing protein [Paenibacillus sp. MER TA 81-3]MCM3337247.1 nucleoside recognition domain-containing protein [Paenibacillus sp. MER TA 81-3]